MLILKAIMMFFGSIFGILFVIHIATYAFCGAKDIVDFKDKKGFLYSILKVFDKILKIIGAICLTICTVFIACFYPFMWIVIKVGEFTNLIEKKQKYYQ